MEPDNHVDMFAVCVEKDQTVVGHLKKGDSGKFAKTNYTYCNCYAEVSGKQWNLKDGEGPQVPYKIILTRQKKYVNILKHELKEPLNCDN